MKYTAVMQVAKQDEAVLYGPEPASPENHNTPTMHNDVSRDP